jgi:hypothetical protein
MRLRAKATAFFQYLRNMLGKPWTSREAGYRARHQYSQDGHFEKMRYQKARRKNRNNQKSSSIGRRRTGQVQTTSDGVTLSWAVY